MKLKPLGARALIRIQEPESQTKSGLYLPEQGREKPHKGEVLAVGPGTLLADGNYRPLPVKPGDVIMFTPYAWHKTEGMDKFELIVQEDHILAVIEP